MDTLDYSNNTGHCKSNKATCEVEERWLNGSDAYDGHTFPWELPTKATLVFVSGNLNTSLPAFSGTAASANPVRLSESENDKDEGEIVGRDISSRMTWLRGLPILCSITDRIPKDRVWVKLLLEPRLYSVDSLGYRISNLSPSLPFIDGLGRKCIDNLIGTGMSVKGNLVKGLGIRVVG